MLERVYSVQEEIAISTAKQLNRLEARAQYEVKGDLNKISAVGKIINWQITNVPTDTREDHVETKKAYKKFLPPKANGDQIGSRLEKMVKDDGAFIFTNLIAFKNKDDKKNWKNSVSYCDPRWTTVNTWMATTKDKKDVRLALAYINPSPATPATKVRPQKLPPKYYMYWHVYAIAFIKKGGEKTMLMWDSGLDANRDPKPAGDQLFGVLKLLWKKENPGQVYINTDMSYCCEGRCLERAMQRLESWAKHGDREFEGPDDPRIEGMRRLPTRGEYDAANKKVQEAAAAEKKLKKAEEKSNREEKGASKHPNKKQKLRR